MAFVMQKFKSDCGVACLAMLCDVSYEKASRSIPWRREGRLFGINTKMIREAALKLGWNAIGTEGTHRLIPLRGRNFDRGGWEGVPANSLVKVPTENDPSRWHWVVWRKGKIYDPALGVFKVKAYNKRPTSYMMFERRNEP